jgi:hypothetical protein
VIGVCPIVAVGDAVTEIICGTVTVVSPGVPLQPVSVSPFKFGDIDAVAPRRTGRLPSEGGVPEPIGYTYVWASAPADVDEVSVAYAVPLVGRVTMALVAVVDEPR